MKVAPEGESITLLRPIGLLGLAVVLLGASCPHEPWAYQPIPSDGPRPEVYFDSGAVVKARLDDDDVVRGTVLASLAPGGDRLVLCEHARGPCQNPDGSNVRRVPLTAVERLEFPQTSAGIGADLGFRLGMLAALVKDEDDDAGLMMLGGLAGGALGLLIGSRFTDWITVAERKHSGELEWVPKVPALIPLPPAGYEFVTDCARGNSLPTGDLVAVVNRKHTAYLTDALRAWEVDTTNHRLIPTHAGDVRCRNRLWEEPATAVPYELENEALTFTPSPGKARIYVYHIEAWRNDLGLLIELDRQTIGRVTYGTFLMVEVNPGPHRVSHPGKSKSDLLLDAAADSSYFVKVSYKIGLSGPALDRMERLNSNEGQKLILTARMLTSTPPDVTQSPYEDVRVIGLVEVPGVFGTRDRNGSPGLIPPAKIEPIPLHALPSSDSRIIGTVTGPDEVEAREYDYEALAAVTYERRDSWHLIRLRAPEGELFGWLSPTHGGYFRPLRHLLLSGLTYLTDEWDGRLFPNPRAKVEFTRLEPSEGLREIDLKSSQDVDGALWLQIEILAAGRCEQAQEPRAIAQGWIPAHAPNGQPNAWFHPRGC